MKRTLAALLLISAACASWGAGKLVAPKSAEGLLAGATRVWSQDFESFAVGASPYPANCGTNDCFGVSDWRSLSGRRALLVEPGPGPAQPTGWSWSVSDFGDAFLAVPRGHLVVRFAYFCDTPLSTATACGFSIGFADEPDSAIRIALGGESSLRCVSKTKSGGVVPKDKLDKLLPVGFGFPTQKAYHWYRYTVKIPVGKTPDGNVSATMEELGSDGKWKFLSGGCLSEPAYYTQAANARLTLSGPAGGKGASYRAFIDDLEVYVAKGEESSLLVPRDYDAISLDE